LQAIPYLFSCSVESSLQGGSVVKAADVSKAQPLLPDQIFVSLVSEAGTKKEVTVPAIGRWIDYWNEQTVLTAGSTMQTPHM